MSGPVVRRAAVRLLRPLAARGGVLAVAATTSADTSCLGVAGQLFAPSSFAATCGFRALTTKAPVPFAAKLVLEEEEEEGEANVCGNQGKVRVKNGTIGGGRVCRRGGGRGEGVRAFWRRKGARSRA